MELIQRLGPGIPLLGVCLGHQAIGEAFGGQTIRAARIMHGKTAAIRHTGEGLFQGVPKPLTVARYQSLVTDPDLLPDVLDVAAWSEEGEPGEEIQAVRHREFPIWGVQFHPESLFSQGGKGLLANFLAL